MASTNVSFNMESLSRSIVRYLRHDTNAQLDSAGYVPVAHIYNCEKIVHVIGEIN